eukprot:UN00788
MQTQTVVVACLSGTDAECPGNQRCFRDLSPHPCVTAVTTTVQPTVAPSEIPSSPPSEIPTSEPSNSPSPKSNLSSFRDANFGTVKFSEFEADPLSLRSTNVKTVKILQVQGQRHD